MKRVISSLVNGKIAQTFVEHNMFQFDRYCNVHNGLEAIPTRWVDCICAHDKSAHFTDSQKCTLEIESCESNFTYLLHDYLRKFYLPESRN